MGKKVVFTAEQEQLLISLVEQRRVLWDKTHPQHKNSYILAKSWDEVAKQLELEKNNVKNKWKSLKKRLALELQLEASNVRSGSAAAEDSDWEHYQSLSFLRDSILPNESTGNLTSLFDSDSDSESNKIQLSVHPNQQQTTMSKSKNTKTDELLNVEREKLLLMKKALKENKCVPDNNNKRESEEKLDDDDMLFFQTYRNYMKLIPQREKLSVRKEINQIIEKYAFKGKDSAVSTPISTSVVATARSVQTAKTSTKNKRTKVLVIEDSDDNSDLEIVADVKVEKKPKIEIKEEKKEKKMQGQGVKSKVVEERPLPSSSLTENESVLAPAPTMTQAPAPTMTQAPVPTMTQVPYAVTNYNAMPVPYVVQVPYNTVQSQNYGQLRFSHTQPQPLQDQFPHFQGLSYVQGQQDTHLTPQYLQYGLQPEHAYYTQNTSIRSSQYQCGVQEQDNDAEEPESQEVLNLSVSSALSNEA